MLSGKISKSNQLVAQSLQNINGIICLCWGTHIYTHLCVCIQTNIHTYIQKAVQGLISHLNCDEDDGVHTFSFLLENHIYCSVQGSSSELVKQRKMNASASLLCLLMVTCTEVYPTCCLAMPLALACSLPSRTGKLWYQISLDLKMKVTNFLDLCRIFILSL